LRRAEADEVVCLHALASFSAVESYYLKFEQTSYDEVRRLLQETSPGASHLW
jgi:predicted phosphoribosyltransferase